MKYQCCAIYLVLLCLSVCDSFGQDAKDYMISMQTDLIKTDNVKLFDKVQMGVEFNYFPLENFTATTGIEVWTNDELSFTIGGRWYPAKEAFVRLRGLIGENDLSLGAGWIKPLNERLKFEAIGDFYFSVDFSIRVGIAFVIPRE
jgi:hypothetical protein